MVVRLPQVVASCAQQPAATSAWAALPRSAEMTVSVSPPAEQVAKFATQREARPVACSPWAPMVVSACRWMVGSTRRSADDWLAPPQPDRSQELSLS
jgi:hypothetical protein